MDHLTSLSLGQVEVGQLIIPVGTIGPVYIKIGEDCFLKADQFRAMAKGIDITTIDKRREWITSSQVAFPDYLTRRHLVTNEFFALDDEEVHLLYVDCKKLRGTIQ